MEFRILGPIEVLDGDRPVALPGGRGRALLALLTLHPGRVVSTERLIDELWGESPPPTAGKALQGLVSALRKRLEPGRSESETFSVLCTAPPGYVLKIEASQVDSHRFRRLLDEAGGAEAPERSLQLRQALGMWRGPAMADFTYEPFAQREIASLEELRLRATEELFEADLALGRHSRLVAQLEKLITEHPFRERLHGQLMLALYRSGRQADALEAYRAARAALAEELGIEPGPALKELEQAILRQDPSLDLRSHEEALVRAEPIAPVSEAAGEGWLPAERRMVTAIFVDLAASLETDMPPDPEAVLREVAHATDVVAGVLKRHGASVEELFGGGLVGLFGVPAAHEDDALRAVRAAAELREALTALNNKHEDRGIRVPIRAGVETGEVVVGAPGSEHPIASGHAINSAARLQREAADGEVLVGESTGRMLQGAAVLEPLMGSEPGGRRSPAAWRFVDLIAGAPAVVRHLDVPMVGRAAELSRLRGALDRAVAQGTGYRFTVLGDAGIGKSRLALEFAEALGSSAHVLTGRCPAYGDGITFWPLREVVLEVAGPGLEALVGLLQHEDDGEWIATQVAGALGLTPQPGRADELFPAIRRFFEALSSERPLVVILEDLHWAEPTLLDLIEYLAGSARRPVFLLCLARPELIEERPAWGAGGRNADTLFLEPLSATDAGELIAHGHGTLAPETLERIVETAQGNPLFVEQMLASIQDDGTVAVPASIQALLAARLDRLGPAERDLLRCAAVVGSDFGVDDLGALVPDQIRPFIDRHLQVLEWKQLIRPIQPSGRSFEFRHILISLAAYRGMTREDRARLHERFANWLETAAAEPPPELDAILGYHLEQAVEQRRSLGLPADRDTALAVRAAEHLASAGMRAFSRFDLTASENLLSRAKSLLPAGHPLRRPVMRTLAEGYQPLGRHDASDAMLGEILEEVRAEGDRSFEQAILLERSRIRLMTGPDPVRLDAIREGAERALGDSLASKDHAGVARASFVLGSIQMRRGETYEMEMEARRGLAHAVRSGHPREELAALWWIAWPVGAGKTPVREAIKTCEGLVSWRGTEHPGVLSELAMLKAMLGEFEESRELLDRARQLGVERMRVRRPLMFVAASSGVVEILAGDPAAAEIELRKALAMATEMAERNLISEFAALLSRVLCSGGRFDEGGELATLSLEAAPSESVVCQALWRAAKARVMAGGHELREAEPLAREAVGLAPTQMLNLSADLLIDLAEVLIAGGDSSRARTVISNAVALYEEKGNLVSADRARDLIN